MPSVSLTVQHNAGVTVAAPGAGAVHLPQRRIYAWAYFGTERIMYQAVVDTGAPACILPWRVWTRLDARGDITWVGSANPTSPRITVFGGNYPFQLGRVRLELVDLGTGQLAPREVLAICTDDPTVAPPHLSLPLIVGLADVLNGRSLLLHVSADGQQWTATLSEP